MAYLRLFHGRAPSSEGDIPALDDWGADGPVFGPYSYFHTTRAEEIEFGDGCVLAIVNGFMHYAGVYYADWSVVDDMTFENLPALRALHAPFCREHSADTRLGVRDDFKQ